MLRSNLLPQKYSHVYVQGVHNIVYNNNRRCIIMHYIYTYKLLNKNTTPFTWSFAPNNHEFPREKTYDISEVGAIPLLSGMLESDQVQHVSTLRTNLNDHGLSTYRWLAMKSHGPRRGLVRWKRFYNNPRCFWESTLTETNSLHLKHWGLEDGFSFGKVSWQVLCSFCGEGKFNDFSTSLQFWRKDICTYRYNMPPYIWSISFKAGESDISKKKAPMIFVGMCVNTFRGVVA